MELIGHGARFIRYHILIEFVVWIFADGLNHTFGQFDVVHVSCLVQLICSVPGFNHAVGRGVKAYRLGIPVLRILGEHLFVALDVGCQSVSTIIPHILVVHRIDTVYAQFIDQALCQWIETVRGCQGVKIWLFRNTMIDDVVLVNDFHANHLAEFGTFSCCKSTCFFFRESLCILIVFLRAFDHLNRHRGVDRFIFVEIKDPLQPGSKVFRCAVGFFVGVDIHPLDTIAKMEFPC